MPSKPFAEFSAELDAVYRARGVKATAQKMRQALREFGELPAVETTADMTPPNFAAWINAHPGRKPNTTHSLLSYLRTATNYAEKMRYLAAEPFKAIPLAKWVRTVEPDAKRHLTLAEIARVFAHLKARKASWEGHRLYALFAVVAYTGIRRMEALHLACADCIFDHGCISIRPRGRRLKTRKSAQPVPMSDRLAEILREWIPRTGSEWLIPGRRGRVPWTGGGPGCKPLDQLKAAGEAAGVEGLTFLTLRHSWATHAESAWGFGEAMIQRNLRHTRRDTQDHYRQPDLVNLRGHVAALDLETPPTPPPPRPGPTWPRSATG